jgi:hypothetical protein
MVLSEPDIWGAALASLVDESLNIQSVEKRSEEFSSVARPNGNEYGSVEKLIVLGASALAKRQTDTNMLPLYDTTPTQRLLRYLVSQCLRFTGPVFFMPGKGMPAVIIFIR